MHRHRLRMVAQEFELPAGTSTIGRGRECYLSIEDPTISREHVVVSVTDDTVVVRDLGSSNGTLLNGAQLVGSAPLRDGDRLRLGKQEIVYVLCESTAPEEMRTARVCLCAGCRAPFIFGAACCPQCG